LPFVDLILFDVKEVDPVLHQRFTGQLNGLILDNLPFSRKGLTFSSACTITGAVSLFYLWRIQWMNDCI
jgi:pyruvate-formate lyase-activating enzyme